MNAMFCNELQAKQNYLTFATYILRPALQKSQVPGYRGGYIFGQWCKIIVGHQYGSDLAPKIFRWLLDFSKICAALL
jgi:hypothetical protein